jgi:hypothetical protein
MARPSEYNYELAKEICDQIGEGNGIKYILDNNDNYPAFSTWCRWVDNNEQLRNIYYASMKDKAHAKESKYEQYVKDLESGKMDPHTGKVLLDAVRWQMATLNAKIYGPKTNVTNDGEQIDGISIVIHKKDAE